MRYYILLLCSLFFLLACNTYDIPEKIYTIERKEPYLSKKQVRKILFQACTNKGWSPKDIDDNIIELRFPNKNDSDIILRIRYSKYSYKIQYAINETNSVSKENADFESSHLKQLLDDVNNEIIEQISDFRKGMVVRY